MHSRLNDVDSRLIFFAKNHENSLVITLAKHLFSPTKDGHTSVLSHMDSLIMNWKSKPRSNIKLFSWHLLEKLVSSAEGLSVVWPLSHNHTPSTAHRRPKHHQIPGLAEVGGWSSQWTPGSSMGGGRILWN